MHDFMIVIFVELNISYAIFIPKFEGGLEILGLTPSVCYNLSCAEIAASIMAIVWVHNLYYYPIIRIGCND